jgi:hypothetical protein
MASFASTSCSDKWRMNSMSTLLAWTCNIMSCLPRRSNDKALDKIRRGE